MQAAPPPGYGAPGQTGYFTTQSLGGFYAPISNNPPFGPAAQPQPQLFGTPGSAGQLFNGWPGSREEQEKMQQQQAEEVKKQEAQQRGNNCDGDNSQSRASSHRNDNNRGRRDGSHKSKTTHTKGRSTPWEEVVERLGDVTIKDEGDEDDDTASYDHCENSDGSNSPTSSARGSNSPTGSNSDGSDNGNQEVIIQTGGSARVIVHLNHFDRPPSTTTFLVSARRMLSLARGWPRVCHQGMNDFEVTANDGAAVLGMYWLLQVLHMSVEEQQFYQGHDATTSSSPDFKVHRLRPGMAPATTPRQVPPTIPSELPARVLAYATMYANHIGVLDNAQGEKQQQMLGNGPGALGSPASISVPADRFRSRAETWMRAVTTNPRCRRTLDSALVAPADWPFVLYTARVLGDRQLFTIVLRTLLDRWWLNERGIFCDVDGPARIDRLPDAIREVVLRDLSELSFPLPPMSY
ncbi:hypothetical protein Sste5346_008491 [Sporothrix stenoceras]|uniref:C6 zinc finger domain containing protein n=1 Tax=Sporothrix stenoceras TaxID=5173 RepID=A0ABR3YQC9_9PEZI